MSIGPSDFYDMTMLEFWSCYEIYCKKNGINAESADPESLRELMDKYGARSPSIRVKHGQT